MTDKEKVKAGFVGSYTVKRVGNSLKVTLPLSWTKQCRVSEGTLIALFKTNDGRLVIVKPRLNMDGLEETEGPLW